MALVELDNVGFQVGNLPVLAGIDLRVAAGERVGIAGANGAGKTTLLLVAATLLQPTSGSARILGAEIGNEAMYAVRPRIGLSGHQPAVYPEFTLLENLEHVARLTGTALASARQVLEQVGLGKAAGRRAADSSEGMRRRLDLARLLMLEPELVLLDEAHAGLDADARLITEELARRTVRRDGAVVMVSHDADALTAQTDRVLRIAAGALQA